MMMDAKRAKRVGVRIRQEVADLLLRRVKDPRIGFVTITEVDVSPDLRRAKIYYSVVGTEVDRQRAAEGLHRASSFIKRELAPRLQLKFMPEIGFVYDPSLEYGDRIEKLLRDIRQEGVEGD
jgi:ribosome-binding factor A